MFISVIGNKVEKSTALKALGSKEHRAIRMSWDLKKS